MKQCKGVLILLCVLMLLSACQPATSLPPTATPEPTATAVPPTAIPMPTPSATPTEIPVERIANIPFRDASYPQHELDIYLPTGQTGPFPTLLFMPTDWRRNFANDMAYYFARRGYATIMVDLPPLAAEPFPAQLEASFCALGWLHANAATYGLDSANIFTGGSFGMASWATLPGLMPAADATAYLTDCPHALPETNRVRGMIMVCGYFDYTIPELQRQWERDLPNFFGKYAENVEPWENASAITWADESDPPLLFVCGDDLTSPLSPIWADILSVVHDRAVPQIQQTGIEATVIWLFGNSPGKTTTCRG